MNIDNGLSLLRLFRYKYLHKVNLGLSRLLEVCASDMLMYYVMYHTEFRNDKSVPRSFKSARVENLKNQNNVLSHVSRESPSVGLRFDFRKPGSNDVLSDLFQETGIASIIA